MFTKEADLNASEYASDTIPPSSDALDMHPPFDRAVVAVLTSIEAKANNPNTTPAELKELALAMRAFSQTQVDSAELQQVEDEILRLSERCAGLEQMAAGIVTERDAKLTEAQATIAILEDELVSARRIASENGARCDDLQKALASSQNNVSVLDAALDHLRADAEGGCRAELHKILDTAHIPDATIAERVKEAAGAVTRAANLTIELDLANEHVDCQRKTIRALASLLDVESTTNALVVLVGKCVPYRHVTSGTVDLERMLRDVLGDRFDALRDAAIASGAAPQAQPFGVALHDAEKHEEV